MNVLHKSGQLAKECITICLGWQRPAHLNLEDQSIFINAARPIKQALLQVCVPILLAHSRMWHTALYGLQMLKRPPL